MNNKKNIILICALLIGVLMLGCAGYFLYKGIVQFNEEDQKLTNARSDLDGIYAKNPFPSDKNRKIEQGNLASLGLANSNMVTRMRQAQIEPDTSKTPSAFKNLLRDKQQEFALKTKSSGVSLPKDFAFGFQKYTMGGEMPQVEYVGRLAQQLDVTEKLLDVLCESKVKEITAMVRDEFDVSAVSDISAAGGDKERPRSQSRSRAPRAEAGADTQGANYSSVAKVKSSGLIKEGEQYAAMQFKLEFKAKEEAIVNVLNKFASHDMFIAVTRVEIPKLEIPKIPSFDKTPAQGAAALETLAMEPAANTTNALVQKYDVRDRYLRVVCGSPIEKMVTVKIDLSVYRFVQEVADKKQVKGD